MQCENMDAIEWMHMEYMHISITFKGSNTEILKKSFLSQTSATIFFPRRNGIRTQCFRAFLSIYIYIAHKNRQCYEYINSSLKLKYMDKRIEFISFF